MENNTMMDAINYVQENKLHKEANILANKVGNIYAACLMLYNHMPDTEENIAIVKNIVADRKRKEDEAFKKRMNEPVKIEIDGKEYVYK